MFFVFLGAVIFVILNVFQTSGWCIIIGQHNVLLHHRLGGHFINYGVLINLKKKKRTGHETKLSSHTFVTKFTIEQLNSFIELLLYFFGFVFFLHLNGTI